MIKDTQNRPETPVIAQVSYSEGAGFGAVGESEHRQIPVFAPRGICYRPCEGDNLLLIPVDGADVCAGVLSGENLEPGELALSSAGGARILLKKNGDVVINGVVISRDGVVTPP